MGEPQEVEYYSYEGEMLKNMLASMQSTMEMISSILKTRGIELKMYKIVLHTKEEAEGKPVDDDCPDPRSCIDYVFRLKCEVPSLCVQMKKLIKAEMANKREKTTQTPPGNVGDAGDRGEGAVKEEELEEEETHEP